MADVSDLLAGAQWALAATAPGEVNHPRELPAEPPAFGWLPVRLPDTVAGALRSAGRRMPASDQVDGTDWWFRTTVRGDGPHRLDFEGLATVADVWLDDDLVLHGESMLRSHCAEVTLSGEHRLLVRCAAPLTWLGRRPRPRWKTALVTDQRWRWLRTTVLGRIPTWSGPVAPAGIWRPARLRPLAPPFVATHRLATAVDGTLGTVDVDLELTGSPSAVRVRVGDQAALELTDGGDGHWRGRVRVADAQRWWPHGYGDQPRYPVTAEVDGAGQALGHVAFRTVAADTTGDGFALSVNGVRVFVRGAVWQPLDPVSMSSEPDEVRAALRLLRTGGHTVVRVPATSYYETDDFYAACDELGLLLWQDLGFTALDPPDTDEFRAEVVAEVAQLADRLAGRGCVAVVCGGAETEQQPALLGQSAPPLPLLTEVVPQVLARRLPGVPYVSNTPSAGPLPVHTDTGIAQYFAVGAYLRPLADVRSAGVRFAGETLAFSNPPEPDSVVAAFGSPDVAGHDPRWKAAVPRDPKASWDFEDVRDHYVTEVFGVDPRVVRYSDAERYLDLGRAAICVAVTEVFGWWRRPRSGCDGGIVLCARDFAPGAGWGIVGTDGRPKAPWFALRGVLAPTALIVGDDAGAGSTVTVVHDGPAPITATLQLRLFGPAGNPVGEVDAAVDVPPHGAVEVSLDEALGVFTDTNRYYRFGPRYSDVLTARLVGADGGELARSTALLGHHLRPVTSVSTRLTRVDTTRWSLEVHADHGAVQWLAVEAAGCEFTDSWFHLAPGEGRRVTLTVPPGAVDAERPPAVTVRALNVPERFVAPEPDDGG